MTFDEVVDGSRIKRPDKLVVIQNAVNAQLKRCVLKTSFSHDLIETLFLLMIVYILKLLI